MMKLLVTIHPTEEPIGLSEAKLHLRVDDTADDDLITALIVAARQRFEAVTWRSLITQTLVMKLDSWPCGQCIELPRPPLVSVSSVQYTDDDGVTATFASSNYLVSTAGHPGAIVLKNSADWPTTTLQAVDGISVTYVAGYGDAADVPQIIKQAILMMVGHWYENREEIVAAAGVTAARVPFGAQSIMDMLMVR
ncbi:MAG: head-tail connector protein [Caldilineaceae bacterium]